MSSKCCVKNCQLKIMSYSSIWLNFWWKWKNARIWIKWHHRIWPLSLDRIWCGAKRIKCQCKKLVQSTHSSILYFKIIVTSISLISIKKNPCKWISNGFMKTIIIYRNNDTTNTHTHTNPHKHRHHNPSEWNEMNIGMNMNVKSKTERVREREKERNI